MQEKAACTWVTKVIGENHKKNIMDLDKKGFDKKGRGTYNS